MIARDLPKYCSWNTDRHGRRRVRFRKGFYSTYISGVPYAEDFMHRYHAALDGEPVAELVPFMLESFLKADAGFRKGRKELEDEPMALPLVKTKSRPKRSAEVSNEEAGS